MINSKFLKQERDKLKNKYNNNNVLFQKNDLFETIPRPTPLSYEILKRIYSSQGSLGMAYDKLGFYYNKTLWNKLNFIETIFGNIMINKNQEKAIFDPFYRKRLIIFFLPRLIYQEIRKIFAIKKNYKTKFYKNVVYEIINLSKILNSSDISCINNFIGRFINLYQHTFVINIIFADCLKNLSKKIQSDNINLILSQSIKTIDKDWQKYVCKDLIKILNDWSFRVSNDLELYCDKYIKTTEDIKKQNFKIDLDKIIRNIPWWQKDFYKKEIINLLWFKEMAQNAKHLFAYSFNKFRICLYQIGEDINLADKRDICFLKINEINNNINYGKMKNLILKRKEKYFALLNKRIGNKMYLKDLI